MIPIPECPRHLVSFQMPVMSSDPVDSFAAQNQLLACPFARHLSSGRATGTLGHTGLEAVLELAGNGAKVPHAAGTGGLSSLGLLGPVVCVFPINVSNL